MHVDDAVRKAIDHRGADHAHEAREHDQLGVVRGDGLRERGVSTILVEQRVDAVLSLADRVAFIENGQNRETVPVAEVRSDPAKVRRYVGVG